MNYINGFGALDSRYTPPNNPFSTISTGLRKSRVPLGGGVDSTPLLFSVGCTSRATKLGTQVVMDKI